MESEGKVERELHEALLDAFPTFSALEQLARFGVGINLHEVAETRATSATAFSLIVVCRARGALHKLGVAARDLNPTEKLKEWCRKYTAEYLDKRSIELRLMELRGQVRSDLKSTMKARLPDGSYAGCSIAQATRIMQAEVRASLFDENMSERGMSLYISHLVAAADPRRKNVYDHLIATARYYGATDRELLESFAAAKLKDDS